MHGSSRAIISQALGRFPNKALSHTRRARSGLWILAQDEPKERRRDAGIDFCVDTTEPISLDQMQAFVAAGASAELQVEAGPRSTLAWSGRCAIWITRNWPGSQRTSQAVFEQADGALPRPAIGERRKPDSHGRRGYLCIDTVHPQFPVMSVPPEFISSVPSLCQWVYPKSICATSPNWLATIWPPKYAQPNLAASPTMTGR